VSTDGGKTYTSLPIDGTTSDHDPSAYPTVQSNVPGFTGPSGGYDDKGHPVASWVTKTADLSDYAGKSILLSFRYITDWGTTGAGVWVDNVNVGGTSISDGSSTDAFRSATQVSPVPVAGWTVQLVAYGDGKKAYVGSLRVRYNANRNVWTASVGRDVASIIGHSKKATTVAALVTADDPSETARKYAGYTLTVNGVTQAGGS
jgi:bacillopeptidase F (M6 metalloprotease family)